MGVESVKYGDICDKCAHCGYCDMAQFGGHEPPITACSSFKEKSQTNADHIRAMSDEELAEFLTTVAQNSANKLCESLKTVDVDLSNCDFNILNKAHLSWLKQPAKESEDGEIS